MQVWMKAVTGVYQWVLKSQVLQRQDSFWAFWANTMEKASKCAPFFTFCLRAVGKKLLGALPLPSDSELVWIRRWLITALSPVFYKNLNIALYPMCPDLNSFITSLMWSFLTIFKRPDEHRAYWLVGTSDLLMSSEKFRRSWKLEQPFGGIAWRGILPIQLFDDLSFTSQCQSQETRLICSSMIWGLTQILRCSITCNPIHIRNIVETIILQFLKNKIAGG